MSGLDDVMMYRCQMGALTNLIKVDPAMSCMMHEPQYADNDRVPPHGMMVGGLPHTNQPRSTCMNESSSGACGIEQGQAEADEGVMALRANM